MRHDLSSGYCCEDHDGPIEDYKRNRYNWLYKNDDRKKLSESIQKAFLKYKNHQKNPNDKLLYSWDSCLYF